MKKRRIEDEKKGEEYGRQRKEKYMEKKNKRRIQKKEIKKSKEGIQAVEARVGLFEAGLKILM